jgi:hypothetical protein
VLDLTGINSTVAVESRRLTSMSGAPLRDGPIVRGQVLGAVLHRTENCFFGSNGTGTSCRVISITTLRSLVWATSVGLRVVR